ncbi:MAG TPA: hypothetical protein PLN89_10740, partial [Elusimicrobiota bacterium]|nr:hypothetical protein [Elusimicrobiota bacterium]
FVPKQGGTYFGQAMTANSIYTIAGTGAGSFGGDGGAATSAQIFSPFGVTTDGSGNVYISDRDNNRIRFIPKMGGTYFGQAMIANYIYTIAGDGSASFGGDGGAATSGKLHFPYSASADAGGNLYIADKSNQRIRFVPKANGTYFGQAMTANCIYTIAGNETASYGGDGGAATSAQLNGPTGVFVDAGGNVVVADSTNNRVRLIPKKSGTYFGQARTANYIYTIGGSGGTTYTGENAAATGKNTNNPFFAIAGPDHMVYITDYNNKIRMIAGEDFIAPSTSTLAVTNGVEEATLSWNSAGDDNVNLGNLTGTYRIQYATYTAVWSTASTPANATTVTISTTNVVPG